MEYVYFFREVNSPFVKIGCAANSYIDRFNVFKTYSPLGAYVVGFIETEKCVKLESKIHSNLKEKRVKGEFFELTDNECYSIINRYDKSFGQILELTNTLIKDHSLSRKTIYSILRKKLDQLESGTTTREIDPEILSIIDSLRGREMNNSEILEILKEQGFIIETMELASILKRMGFKNSVKKVEGISKRVYQL